jgi:NAD(P)H-dependent flavin oxidoreductase YrpB (nitropropane dioxygenase family)
MGVAVSSWPLARAVSRLGQLGVVSGTALAVILARRLQLGDPAGDLRRALSHFPFPEMADRVLKQFFIPGGKPANAPFKLTAMPTLQFGKELGELTVLANFTEVYLAKENHDGLIGINFLEKIQLPTLPSLFGAMLGGVDYVLMGAGIPRAIPGVLEGLARGEAVSLRVDVEGALPGEETVTSFDPSAFCGGNPPPLKRPRFLGIVASATLAMTLAKKASGRVDGFVVEGPTAGGHNAPPRGQSQLSPQGEPIYGPRDVVDLEKIRALGLPFWLAGSYGRPGRLAEALQLGAVGIQVGTAFAFCEESGIEPEIKREIVRLSRLGQARVFTDPKASPTGFPFKVLPIRGITGEDDFSARSRICDLGYLRHLYRKPDGSVGYRCPAEPLEHFVQKGGEVAATEGRKCVCNRLAATVGYGQVRDEVREAPLLTAGDEVAHLDEFVPTGSDCYHAADVVDRLLS